MKDYSDKWWFPVRCNDAYFNRLRKDYPETAEYSDEYLHEYYNGSRKYSITWDHLGDAYAEYEELVDAFFELLDEAEKEGNQPLEEPKKSD